MEKLMSEVAVTADQEANLPVKDKNVFTFQRMGGLDQIALLNDWDWQNLDRLDPKLWMAMSCPTQGLEFSPETLELLDSDHDGRIRAQEVRDAVSWLCLRLVHPESLRKENPNISLSSLRTDTPEGQSLINAVNLILKQQKHSESDEITPTEIDDVIAEASGYPFNGDGIVPPDSASTDQLSGKLSLRDYIKIGLSITGGMRDASGKPGLDATLSEEFQKRLEEASNWRKSLANTPLPLGEATGKAWSLIQKVGPKLDDFFSRCRLASYAPAALPGISGELALQPQALVEENTPAALVNPEALLALPLARVNPEGVLDLKTGLNPAWRKELTSLISLTSPLLGEKTTASLDEDQWDKIKGAFAEYAAVLDKKPSWPQPDPDAEHIENPDMPTLALAPADDPLKRSFLPLTPGEAMSALDDQTLAALLAPKMKAGFDNLVEKDIKAPPLASFQELRKLSLFQKNIYTFLRNFLSFLDFYDLNKNAIFQAGTLYLDSRSCLLCVPVDDIDNHARLSAQSQLCLIYCECKRLKADGAEEKCTIAAALTQGNLASLIDGRHGLFIDNAGQEWDSQIVRIIHNPISLREAAWAPYIRISNMISEQIQKFVADKDKEAGDMAQKAIQDAATAKKDDAQKAQPFDFAKSAGIFAAVSVAVSVLSAAFAYIANSLASLGWLWPFAIVAVFVAISGISMLIAWFKLRKRNLGPLLDASGWAINKGAPINLIMGAALTGLGKLPPNSIRDINDPYSLPEILKAQKRKTRFWNCIFLICVLAIIGFWAFCYFIGEPAWLGALRGKWGI